MRFSPLGLRPWILALGSMALAPLAGSAHEIVSGVLKLEHPWVAAAQSNRSTTTAYVIEIENTGPEPERLLGATLEGAEPGRIEARTANGTTFKPIVDGVIIPAKGHIDMDPNRMQIVFDGLKHPLAEGDDVKGTFRFEHAGIVPLTFHIEPRQLVDSALDNEEPHGHPMEHMHMDHSHMDHSHMEHMEHMEHMDHDH